jgi:radical SAM superfamily enzyme YgiQ (UPF0313 family)
VSDDRNKLPDSEVPIELHCNGKGRPSQLISFDDVPPAPERPNHWNGIDITLIFPTPTPRETTGGLITDERIGQVPPLGLLYLAAALDAKGYEVDVIEPIIMGLKEDDVLNRVAKQNPGVVGISTMTCNFPKSLSLAQRIREKLPQSIILMGGPHPTLYHRGLLEDHQEVDLLCVGEGEVTVVELMNALRLLGYCRHAITARNGSMSSIPGIVYREDGVGCFTGRRSFVDIDTLPFPARHLLPIKGYIPFPTHYLRVPAVHIFVSRGCPNSCSFCCTPFTWGNRVRLRSPEKVIQEIRQVVENYGVKEIAFWDDTLTAEPEWLTEVCERIVAERLDIVWRCSARASDMNFQMAQIMKKAGCWQIAFGIESADEESLRAIRKDQKIEQVKEALLMTRQAGIQTRGCIMLGLPHETPEKAQKTIDFAISCDLDYAVFFLATPYKGTDFYTIAEQTGTIIEDSLERFTYNQAVYIPFGYKDIGELQDIYRGAYKQFYFRPIYWWKMAKFIRSFSDLRRYYRGFRAALALKPSRADNTMKSIPGAFSLQGQFPL